jgi:hypothetical protein
MKMSKLSKIIGLFRRKTSSQHSSDPPLQTQAEANPQKVVSQGHILKQSTPPPVVLRPTDQSQPQSSNKKKSNHKQKHGQGKSSTLDEVEQHPAPKSLSERNSDLYAQAEARYEKKKLKREMRTQINELVQLGDLCEPQRIAAFIIRYGNQQTVLGELLKEIPTANSFPVQMIREYVTTGPSEELEQHILEEQIRRNLGRQAEALKERLPRILAIDVEVTETGPQLTWITPTSLRNIIATYVSGEAIGFSIRSDIPFPHIGAYDVTVDFSHGVSFVQRVLLMVPSHKIPVEFRDNHAEMSLLNFDASTNLYAQLSHEYPDAAQIELDKLTVVLKTAYYYGYGETAWARQMHKEWQRKREYAELITDMAQISNAITVINQDDVLSIPENYDTGPVTNEKVVAFTREAIEKHHVFKRHSVNLEVVSDLSDSVIKVRVSLQGNDLGELEVYKPGVVRPERVNSADNGPLPPVSKGLETLLNKVLVNSQIPKSTPIKSFVNSELANAITLVRRDIRQCDTTKLKPQDTPDNLTQLIQDAKHIVLGHTKKQVDRYLLLARYYGDMGREDELRFSLAMYCFTTAEKLATSTNKRESRPYLLCFFLIYSRFITEIERLVSYTLYRSLVLYFDSYNILVDVAQAGPSDIDVRFDSNLPAALHSMAQQKQHYQIGRCILELYAANSKYVADLINRLQMRKQVDALEVLAKALQEPRVVRSDPYLCLQLLSRINPERLASSLGGLSLSRAEERRLVAISLMSFAWIDEAKLIEHHFAAQMTMETRKDLVFSLFVEGFIFSGELHKESALKARLIAEVLGLPPGTKMMEYFLAAGAELTTLFDRFANTTEVNARAEIAFTILAKIGGLRKRLLSDFSLRAGPSEVVKEFTRSLEGYVSSEQNKLIREAHLQLVLVSKRVAHAFSTRVTVEIRYAGANEGIVENLELFVRPVPEQYNVEERHLSYEIDTVGQRLPIQKEIYIQPLVVDTGAINLDIGISYDTLTAKGKGVQLSEHDRTIYLYPEGQFVRVPSVYNISQPAITWFYGRQELLESMADKLRQGSDHNTSMMIYGLKRTGKTSLLKRFLNHTLRDRGFIDSHIPIEIDLLRDRRRFLSDKMSNGELLHWMASLITKRLNEKRLVAAEDQLIEQFEFQRDPYLAFNAVIRRLLDRLHGRRLIIALDEFSELHRHLQTPGADNGLTSDVFSFLSNVIQETPSLTFIFAGTYVLLEMNRQPTFDLAKICSPQLVSFLDEPSARRLVEEPVRQNPDDAKAGWLEYGRGVVDRIVSVTNSHPYFIQYLCMQLVERMNAIKHNTANLYDIETIITDFIYKPAHHVVILQLWNEFQLVQHELLSTIAYLATTGESWVSITEVEQLFHTYGEPLSLKELRSVCASLTDAELLERSSPAGDNVESYRISIPLFMLWLRQNKQPVEVFGREPLAISDIGWRTPTQ